MRKICLLSAFAASVFAISAATAAPSDDIVAKVAGKSITRTNGRGQVYTTKYNKDGTTFSRSTRADGGSGYITSPGNWWVDGDKVCETYKYWLNSGTWCHSP